MLVVSKIKYFYIVHSPVYFNSKNLKETEGRIHHVVQTCRGLMADSRCFYPLIGLNASVKEVPLIDIQKFGDRFKSKDLGITCFSWTTTKEHPVNYSQIRNNLFSCQENRTLIERCTDLAQKCARGYVKILSLDPDTNLDTCQLTRIEECWQKNPLHPCITAGNYLFECGDQALFKSDKSLCLESMIANVATQCDFMAKRELSRSGYCSFPKDYSCFNRSELEAIIETVEHNVKTLDKKSRLYGLYENLLKTLKKFDPNLKDEETEIFTQFYTQMKKFILEAEKSLPQNQAGLECVQYPCEALMFISMFDKTPESSCNLSPMLLKEGSIWGKKGAAEGECLVGTMATLWKKASPQKSRKIVDYSFDFHTAMPARFLKLGTYCKLPTHLPALVSQYSFEGYNPNFIDLLVSQCFEKPQNCMGHYYLDQREAFVKSDRFLVMSSEGRETLLAKFTSKLDAIKNKCKNEAVRLFKMNLLKGLVLPVLKDDTSLEFGPFSDQTTLKVLSPDDQYRFNLFALIHDFLSLKKKSTTLVLNYI